MTIHAGHGAARSTVESVDAPRHLVDLAAWPRADAQQPKDAPNASARPGKLCRAALSLLPVAWCRLIWRGLESRAWESSSE